MKPRLVLLHGWAVNSLIWNPILDQLRDRYELTVLDLPGYGTQIHYDGDHDIETVVGDVLSRAPEVANWVGWSLGGTIALAAAIAQPQRFEKLQLISTTPRFLNSEQFLNSQQWNHGVAIEPFEALAQGFESDYFKSLKRFLLLQTFSEDPAEKKQSVALVRELSSLLSQSDPPSQSTLQSGLQLLRQTDLRDQLRKLTIQTQVIAGQSDRVVPMAASEYLFDQLVDGHLGHSFKSLTGGHLPFLQSPSDYIGCLEEFIQSDSVGES